MHGHGLGLLAIEETPA